MKRLFSLIIICMTMIHIVAACSSNEANVTLDKKHKPLPDYVLNSSEKIKETYIMVSNYPEVVANVPCYCGCFAQDGHKSNLDCYIDHFGENNAVEEWDAMSIS
ncbi:hypothetical protein AM1BK_04960 [Neobacillus kokaensis]|uniref:Lipoprotein n=2 Tax=Neobacillus kokaensis TaxID=2759023 RepID=A0ABQ3MW92_9BACI|nr:hypothetical protein AM1BK_04960 [Neobacillus kokaensis]